MVSNSEILYYLKKYKSGKLEYLDKIIKLSIPYVKNYISKYSGSYLDDSDLMEYGLIGIIKGIENFDIKDKSFFSLASYYIKNEIVKALLIEKKESLIKSLNYLSCSNNSCENIYLSKEIITSLVDCISSLPFIEQEIIKDYFGLQRKKLRVVDISNKYNYSCTKVGKIISKVLIYLRFKMQRMGYDGYIR